MIKREKLWRADEAHRFRLNPKNLVRYFDKTQSLQFNEETARIEEETLLPFVNINSHSRVLDLGCGNGRWARVLADRCQEYIGVDVSKKFLESARRSIANANAQFIYMPAQNYCVTEQYDLILAIGLMTYLNDEDIVKLSANCRQMLSNGGRLIVRNVSLGENPSRRMVYDYKPGILRRLLGAFPYQVIRRNREEELSFFRDFRLIHEQQIAGTGYTFYIFE